MAVQVHGHLNTKTCLQLKPGAPLIMGITAGFSRPPGDSGLDSPSARLRIPLSQNQG